MSLWFAFLCSFLSCRNDKYNKNKGRNENFRTKGEASLPIYSR